MWHQLVLHGVGGKTIAEAKENMTYGEYLDWCAYIKKRGSLDLGLRLEYGFALVSMLIQGARGVKTKMTDFMPHYEQEPERHANIQEVFSMLKKSARKK